MLRREVRMKCYDKGKIRMVRYIRQQFCAICESILRWNQRRIADTMILYPQ